MSNNPFIIVDDRFSPFLCENLLNDLIITQAVDEETPGSYISEVIDETINILLKERLSPLFSNISERFEVTPQKIEKVVFKYFKGPCNETPFKADNSVFMSNVWVRNEYNDFTITLFLTSYYNPSEKLDTEFESLGGQLQFPQHNMSVYPDRGGIIIHPSDNHFVKNNSAVIQGTCAMIDVLISCDTLYLYDPVEFSKKST